MKAPKALGMLGQMEAARAAVLCSDPTTADLVVGILVATAPLQQRTLPDNPTSLGIDLAAPDGGAGKP